MTAIRETGRDKSDTVGVAGESSPASPSRISLDHPGWFITPDGLLQRAFSSGHASWVITCEPIGTPFESTVEIVGHTDTIDVRAAIDWFDPTILPTLFQTAQPIRDRGRVHRIRNPDLWDALLPPLLHQRRTAAEAARMYHNLCFTHGERITTTAGTTLAVSPRPETIATLNDNAFNNIGLRGKATPLRTVAKAYTTQAANWPHLSPTDLFLTLQNMTYIGPWTAGAAVADVTNDFSFYQIGQLATIRHWEPLPTASNDALTAYDFHEERKNLNREQRSTLSLLMLGWITRHNLSAAPAATQRTTWLPTPDDDEQNNFRSRAGTRRDPAPMPRSLNNT